MIYLRPGGLSGHLMGFAQLVQCAVDSDLDLKLAAARVEEARAVRGIEKSALYQSLTAGTVLLVNVKGSQR